MHQIVPSGVYEECVEWNSELQMFDSYVDGKLARRGRAIKFEWPVAVLFTAIESGGGIAKVQISCDQKPSLEETYSLFPVIK